MGKLSARKKIVKRRVEIGKVVPETVELLLEMLSRVREGRIDEVDADHGDFGDAIIEDEGTHKEWVVHPRIADEVFGKRDLPSAGS